MIEAGDPTSPRSSGTTTDMLLILDYWIPRARLSRIAKKGGKLGMDDFESLRLIAELDAGLFSKNQQPKCLFRRGRDGNRRRHCFNRRTSLSWGDHASGEILHTACVGIGTLGGRLGYEAGAVFK